MYAIHPEREGEGGRSKGEREREIIILTHYICVCFRLPPFHFSMKLESTQEKH